MLRFLGLPPLFLSKDRPCHPRREKEKRLDVATWFASKASGRTWDDHALGLRGSLSLFNAMEPMMIIRYYHLQ